MKVREIMKKSVRFCADSANLYNVARMMKEGDCGILPVVDNKGELTGVITDRDITLAIGAAAELPSFLLVRDIFSAPAFCCRALDDVHSALDTMRLKKVRRLPVLDREGHIAGILSMDDVVLSSTKREHREPELSYDDVVETLKSIYRGTLFSDAELGSHEGDFAQGGIAGRISK